MEIVLTSVQNPLLQKVRRAVEHGRALEDGTVPAEGPNLLVEAMKSSWCVEHIFCSTESLERHRGLLAEASRRRIELTQVSPRAFSAITATEQSQGVLALIRPRTFEWHHLLESPGPLVILDGIQDPGNAGTIIRSTEAFGGAGIVMSDGCTRISNGKLLRAAAGSIFRIPHLENVSRSEVINQLRLAARPLYSLVPTASESLFTSSLSSPFALVVGSEGSGVSALLTNASRIISIPTQGVESLNAATACSVTLFEAARQRWSGAV